MEATARLVDAMMKTDLELMLWIRFILVWNAVLTAAVILAAIVFLRKLREAKDDFVEAVREALK